MKFDVDYSHIFFDRYSLTDDEKRKEAIEILNRVFTAAEVDEKHCRVKVRVGNAEEETRLNESLRLLKREFFLLLKTEPEPEVRHGEQDIIDVAERCIRKNYLYEGFCAARVCEYCNIGRRKLERGFEKRFSKSVSEYIKDLRTRKAAELIEDGDNMEEIAHLCGFGSVKTMQRAFKCTYGKTPRDYRTARLDSDTTK